MDEILSVSDVAKSLKRSKSFVYSLIYNAKETGFPYIRIGGAYLVFRNKFEKYLEDNSYPKKEKY